MAQLYYKYGTMNSGKTIEILKVAHNYEEQGKSVVIMTSAIDTRDGVGVVSSRIGMKREAVAIEDDTDIFGFIKNQTIKPYCVLIDEAQFLKRHHVYDLARVVDELDVPVMAFGLKNDFRNELFEWFQTPPLVSRQDRGDQNHLPILFPQGDHGLAYPSG